MPRIPLSRALTTLSLLAFAASVSAQQVEGAVGDQAQTITFSLGKTFTFLFLTLGPLKLLAPFAQMTRSIDTAAKRRLALSATVIGFFALLVASTMGVNILVKWNVAPGSLLMTAGIIFFLVALKPVLEQFAPHRSPQSDGTPAPLPPAPFALAFPTIITPYGIAILIVLLSLRPEETSIFSILGAALVILILDLLAMLFADTLLKIPLVAPTLGIVGVVLGVLQVALGVQAMVVALRLLGFRQ